MQIEGPTNRTADLKMWGIHTQRCSRGSGMVASTVSDTSAVEQLTLDLYGPICLYEPTATIALDRRVLAEVVPPELLENARSAVRAIAQLRLQADGNIASLEEKSDLLKSAIAGRRPELAEEAAKCVESVCQSAFDRVGKVFGEAAANSPSSVDSIVADLVKALDEMSPIEASEKALGRLEVRLDQLSALDRLRDQLREGTLSSLRIRLLEAARLEYRAAIDELAGRQLRLAWQRQRDALMDVFEDFRRDADAFRVKLQACTEELQSRCETARQRTATMAAGNHVVLKAAGEEEFRTALMASRQASGHAELIASLRAEYEQKLRQAASSTGLGQEAGRLPFRKLVLAVSQDRLIEPLREMVVRGVSGCGSPYEAYRRHGFEELSRALVEKSKTTGWLDGRDHTRFGIAIFKFTLACLPEATTDADAETKELLESLLRGAGVDQVVTDPGARGVSVLRIEAGWPVGIAGDNAALLRAYCQSHETGHVPHLVLGDVIPDSRAGEPAPGILKLLEGPKTSTKETVE